MLFIYICEVIIKEIVPLLWWKYPFKKKHETFTSLYGNSCLERALCCLIVSRLVHMMMIFAEDSHLSKIDNAYVSCSNVFDLDSMFFSLFV